MATEQIKFEITANDKATQKLQALQTRLSALTAPLKNIRNRFMAGFQSSGLDKVTKSLGGVQRAMAGVPIAGTLLAAGGVAALTSSLIKNSLAANTAMGALADLTQRYKVNGQALQVYGEIGADVGVGQEQIAKAFGFLQQNIAKARSGSAPDITLLANVGIKKDGLKKDAASIFADIANIYKKSNKTSDDALKIDYAKQLFGKAGIDIIPLLEQGGERYSEVLKRMQKDGTLFKDSEIEIGDAISDKYDLAQRRLEGLKTRVGIAMSPAINAITDSLTKLLDSDSKGKIIDTFKKLGDELAKTLPQFIEKIPKAVEVVSSFLKQIGNIGNFAGWQNIVMGGLIMLASPFIASTIAITKSLASLSLSLLEFGFRLAVPAISNMIAFTTQAFVSGGAMNIFGKRLATSTRLAYAYGGAFGVVRQGVSSLVSPFAKATASIMASTSAAYANGGAFGVVKKGLVSVVSPFAKATAAMITSTSAAYASGEAFGLVTTAIDAKKLALLASPIGLIIAGIGLAAGLVYKYWQPITAFFRGVMAGISTALQPLKAAFSPLIDFVAPAFTVVGDAIGKVIDWFGSLFVQTNYGRQELKGFSDAGVKVGKFLAGAFELALLPLRLILTTIELVVGAYRALTGQPAIAPKLGGFIGGNNLAPAGIKADGFTNGIYTGPKPVTSANGFTNGIYTGPKPVTSANGFTNGIYTGAKPATAAIKNTRTDIGGELTVNIKTNGQAVVEKVQSKHPQFNVKAKTGAMFQGA